jgi:hypothetical protein
LGLGGIVGDLAGAVGDLTGEDGELFHGGRRLDDGRCALAGSAGLALECGA